MNLATTEEREDGLHIPYEFEAMALMMGTTPKKAAQAVLGWFAAPLHNAGLLEADLCSQTSQELKDSAGAMATAFGLDRGDALRSMSATP